MSAKSKLGQVKAVFRPGKTEVLMVGRGGLFFVLIGALFAFVWCITYDPDLSIVAWYVIVFLFPGCFLAIGLLSFCVVFGIRSYSVMVCANGVRVKRLNDQAEVFWDSIESATKTFFCSRETKLDTERLHVIGRFILLNRHTESPFRIGCTDLVGVGMPNLASSTFSGSRTSGNAVDLARG
jgi:hypothetical protein